MSFLSGSPWQQPGIISGSGGYGQSSSGHQQQQQQQQHKPPSAISGANIPTVPASAGRASAQHSEWHCQGQMAPGGQAACTTQGGGKITLTENEVKLGRDWTDGTTSGIETEVPPTLSFKMPELKMEDEGSRGARPQEEECGLGRVRSPLGSAGQSPGSPLSSHSSPSCPSARLFSNAVLAPKPTANPFRQNNLQHGYTENKDVFYIQGLQVSTQGQGLFPSPQQASEIGERIMQNHYSTGPASPRPGQHGSLKENSDVTGNHILRPSVEKQSVDTQPAASVPPTADLTGGKAVGTAGPTTGLPTASANRANVNIGMVGVGGAMERGNLSHTDNMSSCVPPGRGKIENGVAVHGLSQDVRVASCATLTTEKKPIQSAEPPQRTAVRRAMSDCSHLSVPTIIAGSYPTGLGGSPVMTPHVPNFALMGTSGPPRAPYPHVAVRRSLTVTGGTVMSSPLMTSPVLPSSPPPKRHQGSCETNFLLPVPTPSGRDSEQNAMGKSFL